MTAPLPIPPDGIASDGIPPGGTTPGGTAPGTMAPVATLANLRAGLDAALSRIAARLTALAEDRPLPPFTVPPASALPALCRIFDLTTAEAELLGLCAGAELDEGFAAVIGRLNGSGLVDAALAQRLFGPGLWDMLCPEAPLRRWRLLELAGSGPLRLRPLRIDERIVQALLGIRYLDARLEGVLEHLAAPPALPHTLQAQAHRIARAWAGPGRLPAILLGGRDIAGKRALAGAAATAAGLVLYRLSAEAIPAEGSQRALLALLIERELALSGAALLIEIEDHHHATAAPAGALAGSLAGPVFVAGDDPPDTGRTRLRLDLDPPDPGRRRDLWRDALGPRARAIGPALDRIAWQFGLDPGNLALPPADPDAGPADLARHLWQMARIESRPALDGLAQRIETRAGWDDLVLPPEQTAILHDMAGQLHAAWRVNQDWGWAARNLRGLGAAALFAGPSGTGKTLAAEVIATALDLDLYRIDLSQMVSKYIGETEKNLARIFAAAETGGAILLFDEADALFGKRSEVKDSHDRYANIEVSYLLQQMESYRGLAILTSNQKSALDSAFLRRLRHVVAFPFPDQAARQRIWDRILPPETPREGLDPAALARLNLSGGAIRAVALNAAYLAAAADAPVRMDHIHRAARREYAKLEKPFAATETGVFR